MAIVVLFVGAAALCARGRYLQAARETGLAQFDYGGQLLGDKPCGTDDDLRAQEDCALCCGCVFWTAYAVVALAVAVVATVHCVDARGVRCA